LLAAGCLVVSCGLTSGDESGARASVCGDSAVDGEYWDGTSGYRSYERAHEISAEGKPAIAASSDPVFRGDRTRWNPEELLLAALSACHQLAYLHLCADGGDRGGGVRRPRRGRDGEKPDGAGQFTRVMLRPKVTIAAGRCGEGEGAAS
jgi:organic hydroperoxide reductase OsmC/OhrA